ncbi:hypothetical protein IWX90DRAFT_432498 [Phyllosticta citrichinensis]|uniref:Apple domain-containing protein n=1 Tax=Phyllosticta citrichinensis TaxID=1130410 RepID=A0ABR1XT85_9PEZI
MFSKKSVLGFAVFVLQATAVSAQACVNFAFAPGGGTCNSDPFAAERLLANLIADGSRPECEAAGIYTVQATYVDTAGSTRFVSAMNPATIERGFTGTVPFSFRIAQSTIAAGPVTLRLFGTNEGGRFTTQVSYTHAHTQTLQYTTVTSTTTRWVSSTSTETTVIDFTGKTTVTPTDQATVTRVGLTTTIITSPAVTVSSFLVNDDKTVTVRSTSTSTVSSDCISPRLMLQPTGAPAAEPAMTAPPSKRDELEKRQALTVWSIPYCGTVFSTSIIPRGTTYVQALSTMVDTITSLSRNTIWTTVTAANPTIFLNVSSTVTRTGTQPALTKTAVVNIPRGTVSETIIDTLFRTVYPPISPICGATLFDPSTVSIFQSFTGFNPNFSNLITATTLNYFAGNQLTLQPLPTTPSLLSGFPSLAPSSAPVSPFATTITPGISIPSISVPTISIPDVSPTPPVISSPSVPSVSIPSVSVPVVSIPSVSVVPPASSQSPSVSVPSFSVPSISIPAPSLDPASSSSLGLPSSSISVINVSGSGQSSSISVAIPSISTGSSAPSLSLPTALSSSSSSSASSSATPTPSSSTSTSTTSSSTSTSSSSTAAPSVICPNGNGTVVTTPDGSTFAVECTWDRIGGDLGSKSATSLNQCIQYCSETANCIQVSFVLPNPPGDPSPCYMKNTIMAPSVNQNIWGARKLTSGSALPSSSSSSSGSSTTSTALAAATSYLAAPAGPTCPSANNTVYTVPITGGRFLINCGVDAAGQDMAANPRWASVDRSLWNANLMAQCDATPGCTWISGSGNAGYFKSRVDYLWSQPDIVGMRKLSGSVRVKRNFWDRNWGFGTWGTRDVEV